MIAQTLARVFLNYFSLCVRMFFIDGLFCGLFSILLALTYYVFCFAEGIISCLCFVSYYIFLAEGVFVDLFIIFWGELGCVF